ncbi:MULTISPECIES: glycosyltransferase family 61 protein [unclassified Microcoleus]|uniref:glycosyltransferase family 61 protein n=1 Tax=unclassified Microcoleus TaxID=2642155 RepID=UPI002FD18B6F
MNPKLVDRLKLLLKQSLLATSRRVWRTPLDRRTSIKLLDGNIVYKQQHESVKIPALVSVSGVPSLYFPTERTVSFDPDYVWKIGLNEQIESLTICTSGNTLLNNKLLLDLDFRISGAGILEWPYKPHQITYPLVVAPWSHLWASYYDYVIFVLAKLCRIEEALGKEIWQEAKICYPLKHTSFELEFLTKLGIPESSLIDTRDREKGYHAECAVLGNNQDWYFPSPYDIALLRSKFALKEKVKPYRKLYLSRSGKRKVKNEAQVREVLKEFDFEILEDISRTVDEQIRLFAEAQVVVGPHGAAFTNLLWCQPGTKVMELFYAGYTPPFFYYICQLLGLEYSCILDDSGASEDWSLIGMDMTIDVDILKKEIKKMLG